ncbi:MAG: polyprenyl diphosphate synthase, partial [Desulfovibrionaceae bacterium]|nr:polyprenyl diphosphate synthase [Desulfovibrionaceae bacterium]
EIVTYCRRIGIRHLTLYAFSSENWNRPAAEVSTLFSLLVEFLGQEMPRMLREGIALKVFGDVGALPLAARTALNMAIRSTARGRDMTLNLALNYGAREEIVRAARQFAAAGTRPEDITEESFAQALYSAGQPDPDLVIRTSGEQRLSNFLMFQCAYAELYFTSTAWPDFSPACMEEALADYAKRQRRFGRTQEQVDAEKDAPQGS